jgi:RimJ/RimL family protein N-acetyltransferase
MKFFLETERLILRQFTEDDVDNLYDLNNGPEVVRYTPESQLDRNSIQKQFLPK